MNYNGFSFYMLLRREKLSFSDDKIHFFDNIIDVLGPRFYCNFMAMAIIFVAIFWQFYGEYNRFYCDFMAISGRKKIDFIEIMWR